MVARTSRDMVTGIIVVVIGMLMPDEEVAGRAGAAGDRRLRVGATSNTAQSYRINLI
jgi:hypothetical protein